MSWLLMKLTNKAKNKKELHSIFVKTKVDWLRIQNGADQVTFGREEPCRPNRNNKASCWFLFQLLLPAETAALSTKYTAALSRPNYFCMIML